MRLYVFLIFSIMRRTDNRVFYDTKIAKKYASMQNIANIYVLFSFLYIIYLLYIYIYIYIYIYFIYFIYFIYLPCFLSIHLSLSLSRFLSWLSFSIAWHFYWENLVVPDIESLCFSRQRQLSIAVESLVKYIDREDGRSLVLWTPLDVRLMQSSATERKEEINE